MVKITKYNRKNRAIVSGILVGVASIYAIASHFDIGIGQLNSFLLSTLLFFVAIVGLAAIALLLVKGVGRLLGRGTGPATGRGKPGNKPPED